MTRSNEVTDEEVRGIRDRSRMYLVPGSLGRIIEYGLPREVLFSIALETVYKDARKSGPINVAKAGVDRLLKKLRSAGIPNSKEVADWYQGMKDGIYPIAEILLRNFGDDYHFPDKDSVETSLGQKCKMSLERSERRRKIPEFARAVVGQMNSRLRQEIEEANESTFGYVAEELFQRFKEFGEEKLYRLAWGFLANPNPAKNFLASVLTIYAQSKSLVDNLPEKTFTTEIEGKKITVEVADPKDYPLALCANGFQIVLANGNKVRTYNPDLASWHLQTMVSGTMGEIVTEHRARRTDKQGFEEEKSVLKGRIERHVELNTKLAEETADRERQLAEKERQLQTRESEIAALKGQVNATTAKEVEKLKRKSDSDAEKVRTLDLEVKLLRGELDVAARTEEELRIKVEQYESGVRREDPYTSITRRFFGTEFGPEAQEYAAAIVRGSKWGNYSVGKRSSRDSLEANTSRALPTEESKKKVPEIIDRLKREHVYVEDQGWFLNPHTEEIQNLVLRGAVEELLKWKREQKKRA